MKLPVSYKILRKKLHRNKWKIFFSYFLVDIKQNNKKNASLRNVEFILSK